MKPVKLLQRGDPMSLGASILIDEVMLFSQAKEPLVVVWES